MIAGDKSLVITGVHHIATKNNVTVRVRIFLNNPAGEVFYFDADSLTFEMHKLGINLNNYPEIRNILGVAK